MRFGGGELELCVRHQTRRIVLLRLTQRVSRVLGIALRVVHGGREAGRGELDARIACQRPAVGAVRRA